MIFQIWHVTDYHAWLQNELDLVFPKDYTLVAFVEAETVDDAYRMTNSIDKPWTHNEQVFLLSPPQDRPPLFRSTSIGDVIIPITDIKKCAFVGWESSIEINVPAGKYLGEKPKSKI